MVFGVWLFSLSIKFSGFIHIVACISIFFYTWIIFCYMYILYFVYPFIRSTLDCFCSLAMVNNTATNIHVQVFVWTYIFIFLGYIPRRSHGLTLAFWGLAKLFSKVIAPFYILIISKWRFWFLYNLTNTYYILFLSLSFFFFSLILMSIKLWKTLFTPLSCLGTLAKNQLTINRRFIFRLWVLFHWSVCLYLCCCHTVLITVAL